jgi:Mg/Co/Ni transporter MgtE
VLALFVALIISSSRNSGSQASTLVIRPMAFDEVGLGGCGAAPSRGFRNPYDILIVAPLSCG